MQDEVIFTEDNGVGVITLNRPDRLNALTYSMVQKINKNLNSWEINDNINCIIIEGAGDRSFCAGGDVVKLRKEVLELIPNFTKLNDLPSYNEIEFINLPSNFVSEKVIIKELDYFFTNAISRASKTMSECRQIKKDSKKTGTDNL